MTMTSTAQCALRRMIEQRKKRKNGTSDETAAEPAQLSRAASALRTTLPSNSVHRAHHASSQAVNLGRVEYIVKVKFSPMAFFLVAAGANHLRLGSQCNT
ncbi:unnamed protein product [Symbiodinium natans]|uniref:Uncharacterized protein n=1 Tax=Symbiodinium natans TaxID=878477 RepID=A0A812MV51_9DINO|nr:unnamed protein product [Symbiodinium natans]